MFWFTKSSTELAQTISLFQSGDAEGAKALVMSDHGFRIMESIRSLVKQMEQEETSVGDLRRTAYQKSIRITVICIYAASGIAALGIILLAFSIIREMETREKDAASLRESEAMVQGNPFLDWGRSHRHRSTTAGFRS